jgi:hypothetical protein
MQKRMGWPKTNGILEILFNFLQVASLFQLDMYSHGGTQVLQNVGLLYVEIYNLKMMINNTHHL